MGQQQNKLDASLKFENILSKPIKLLRAKLKTKDEFCFKVYPISKINHKCFYTF